MIDDLADRAHDCDFLLDTNILPDFYTRYDRLVPTTCRKLLSPHYALLKREFRINRKKCFPESVTKILISLGGTDPDNQTATVIEALSPLLKGEISLDVVLGAANPNLENLLEKYHEFRGIRFHVQTNKMAELMAGADLFVGSGGTITWERCCIGLPSLVIAIAANQEPASRMLAELGGAKYLGLSTDITQGKILSAVREMLNDPKTLKDMAEIGQMLVDGQGAMRVADAVLNDGARCEELSGDRSLILRDATSNDLKQYFEWANDPEVRMRSYNAGKIGLEEHQTWFNRKLSSKESKLYVLELDGTPVGQIRFEVDEQRGAEIAFSVDGTYRGKGLGKWILRAGARKVRSDLKNPSLHVFGNVMVENQPSAKAFVASGYSLSGRSIIKGKDSYTFSFVE